MPGLYNDRPPTAVGFPKTTGQFVKVTDNINIGQKWKKWKELNVLLSTGSQIVVPISQEFHFIFIFLGCFVGLMLI